MKKVISHACLAFALLTVMAGVASAQTSTSVAVGGGRLAWQIYTGNSIACNISPNTYIDYETTNFTFTAASGTVTSFPGATANYYAWNGECAQGVPDGAVPSVLALNGTYFLIDFSPGDYGYGSATYTSTPITGILYPKFKVASIIYDAPGNHSNDGFTNTLTDGTTTTTTSNFGVGITDTFSVTGGFLGTGDTLSWSYGNSVTTGNSTQVTDTIAQATGVLNASSATSPNAVNHKQDLFIVWLNPAVSFSATGTDSTTYSMGTQLQTTGDPSPGKPEIQDYVEVYAQAMVANSSGVTTVPVEILQPQVVDGQTLPGLANICAKPTYYPSSCTLANQCGCVPSDFTPVLNQDPLLNFTATESPLNANTSSAALCTNPAPTASCRYVPIMTVNNGTTQVVELLSGPDDVGGNTPINTFAQTDSTQTTQTYTQTDVYTVGYSWDVAWKLPSGTGLDFKSATLFTWTNTESAGEINGSAHQMSVSLSSSTVGCSEYIPIFEDTVYHTFVFQGQVGDSSCP
jgi:hypothetical protein